MTSLPPNGQKKTKSGRNVKGGNLKRHSDNMSQSEKHVWLFSGGNRKRYIERKETMLHFESLF